MSAADPLAAGERRAVITILRILLAHDPDRSALVEQLLAAKSTALADMTAGGVDAQASAAFEATFEEVLKLPPGDPAAGAGA
jgi:hypothetical protein